MSHLLKNKIYITSFIFGVITLFLVVFLIWPLITNIQDSSENLISARNNTTSLEIQNNETINFKKNYNSYKSNLDATDRLLIDPKNPVDFIKFLEDTALGAGVNPKISLSPDSGQANQNFITFQIASSDNFLNIMDFTAKLENGPYLVEIENMTAKLSDSQNDPKISFGKVDATFLIKVFTK